MKALILAAGMGSRLGRPYPKPLTPLADDKTIMQHQIENLSHYLTLHDITVVVGHKKELIMEAFPDLVFVYNNDYDTTNTSKSLKRGLAKLQGDDVLWLNGDVLFDQRILGRLFEHPSSTMAVNTASVGEEEVKYRVNGDGWIVEVSKKVVGGLGEAVGINLIRRKDIPALLKRLDECADSDYFERAIELAIPDGVKFYPIDVSDVVCTEIDFVGDLDRANRQLGTLDDVD
jgi:choline kinase